MPFAFSRQRDVQQPRLAKFTGPRIREEFSGLQAWLIPSAGAAREYSKDDIVDVALVNNDVYNEARVKRITAGDEAQPGSVFGYESLSEDRAIFTQFEFQIPVRSSGSSLTLHGVQMDGAWKA